VDKPIKAQWQLVIDALVTGSDMKSACLAAGYSLSYATSNTKQMYENPRFQAAYQAAMAAHRLENKDHIEDVRDRIKVGLDACLDESGDVRRGMASAYFTGLNLLGKTHAAFIEKTEVTQEILEKKELTEIERAEGQRLAMIRLKDVS
jgi:hypothetical protein